MACPSTTQCTALDDVGNEVTFDPASPGTATPVTVDSGGTLSGVACPSSTQCTAVNGSVNNVTATEITFNPSSGGVVTSATVDPGAILEGVACPSTTQCTALNAYQTEDTFNPTSPGTVTSASFSPGGLFSGLACPSTNQCTAVGGGGNSGGEEASFDPTSPGNPSSTVIDPVSYFPSLACPSTTQCTAVGNAGQEVTFDPTTPGTPSYTPVPVDSGAYFTSLSCPSTTQCSAVDSAGSEVTFNPASPGTPTPVSVDGTQALSSVSCPSTTQCSAVDEGGSGNEVTFDPASPGTPTPVTVDANQFISSLSCPSTTQCTAVDTGGKAVTFDPTSPGTATEATVDPSQYLEAVACPSTTDCVAVDSAGKALIGDPSTGSPWTAEPLANASQPSEVACASTSQCVSIDLTGAIYVGVPAASPAATTTTASAGPTSSTQGQSVTYSATVAPTSGTGAPTGMVTFSVGSNTLCIASLSSGSGTCQASSAPVGTDTVTAAYSGDSSLATSSGTTTETVSTVSLPSPGPYSPLAPARICDTRAGNPSGLSGPATQCDGKTIGAGTSLTVNVAGSFNVPADATAVVVNVTAIRPGGNGYLTVYPAGSAAPTASNLNFKAGQIVANLVEVGVGSGGAINVFSSASTDVAIDLQGYVDATAVGGAGSGLYSALPSPTRVCDTRPANPSGLSGAAAQCNNQPLAAGGQVAVGVAGNFGVPAGATAVVANVTAVAPSGNGYLTVYPDATTRPTASNVNYTAGQVIPNRVIVELGADGSIDVYSSAATNVLVDISGYYTAAGGSGAGFVAEASPTRICDTRAANPSGLSGPAAQCNGAGDSGEPIGAAATLTVQAGGEFGVPANATAVVVNVTAIAPATNTYLTVFPGPTRPTTSDLNPLQGQIEANLVVATLSSSGTISIYNNSGSTNVAVDLIGWYQ